MPRSCGTRTATTRPPSRRAPGSWAAARASCRASPSSRATSACAACSGELWQWSRVRNPRRPFFLLLHTYDAHDPYGEANHPWGGRALPDVRGDPSLFGPSADEGEIFRRCFLDAGTTIALRDALGRGPLAGVLHRYAHSGYKAAPRPALAADLEGAYWGGVRWTDGLLAQTTAWLGRQGLLDNTLLVVTSDHGEGFGEHGSLAHGRLLTDELVRIPLVMVGPEPFREARW